MARWWKRLPVNVQLGGAGTIVTVSVPKSPDSVAVIVTVPVAIPVMSPVELTVAIDVLEDFQLASCVMFAGTVSPATI